jgi:hypothetical protein
MAKIYPPDKVVTCCNDCPGKTAKKRVGSNFHYYCSILQQYRAIDPTTTPPDCPLNDAP